MSRIECTREQDILDAIASARWPDKLSEDLQTHVSACSVCKDVALVAQAFQEDYQSALEQTRVPSAGLVWWRAEIRARREAVRVANRPFTLVQVLAGASGIAATIGLLSQVEFANLSQFILEQPVPLHFVYLTIAFLAVVASVALYFVLSDE